MRGMIAALAALAAACGSLTTREAFSEAALFLRDDEYVAHRYKPEEMPVSLRADLTAAGYACEAAPHGGEVCARSEPAGPGCVMVWTVRITPPAVDTVRAPRCTGVISPP